MNKNNIQSIPMDYRVHGKTIFIKGNDIIGHYKIDGDIAYKVIEHYSGNQLNQKFHVIGTLPTSSEAKLMNDLRNKGII